MTASRLLLSIILITWPVCVFGAANVVIVSGDAPGEGFSDPTPAVPMGGNTGTTVGQQRLNVFRSVANIWGSTLTSSQTIRVLAFFDPLPCDVNSAVLGAAAPYFTVANFGAGMPNTWYPISLAEKLANLDFGPALPPEDRFEVIALFNSDLGRTGCFDGSGWYYGLDASSPGGLVNLATTVLHEFAHGLGFTVGPTNASTGARASGFPSIWEVYLRDLTTRKLWLGMTDAERRASAVNTDNLVWSGGTSLSAAAAVLSLRPEVEILPPGPPVGAFEAQPATFGPPVTPTGISGYLMPAIDAGGPSTLDACEPLTPQSAFSVNGRIALVDRGTCTFTVKVLNAQNAGAIGALIANNVPTGLPAMGGSDPTITIPSLGITQALGQTLREQLRFRGRAVSPVRVSLQRNPSIRSGTTAGYPRMFAPNPFQPGSSVSHWDISLDPNQLMEPFATPDITLSLTPPVDLTFPLLRDIGW
ncbi:MAG TPA: PA domain-containing protein [Bryobacteraceae bacterium]|nr:PA domain-containing protein [Bryobacteraceae bacterium]